MSPRARILVIAGAATALAAGGTVALAVVTAKDKGGSVRKATPLQGAPPLVLDLGVRVDPEARALRRAERLYAKKHRPAAGRIFARYDSPAAQIGSAFSAWPDTSLATVERLARERPGDALVQLHLGYANLWSGHSTEASAAWRKAAAAQPDSPSAQHADDALHPSFPPGEPVFAPSFAPPAAIDRLSPPKQLTFLARDAARPDAHAKLLYGLALQRLGRRISARRQYDAAARLDPRDPETQVAAAVVRFDKSRPAVAFSRLGPLTRRYPHAATVRFHLGLLLLWLARSQPGTLAEGKRQLRLAQKAEPHSPLAMEAKRVLAGLENVQTG
jgi:tetratricopeptide (TPR) repeat protein